MATPTSSPSLSDQIGSSVLNNIISSIPKLIDTSIGYILNLLKQVPLFAKIIDKVQGSDMNKVLAVIFVLFILSFIIPFWILIIINLVLTFTLVFISQRKCIA